MGTQGTWGIGGAKTRVGVGRSGWGAAAGGGGVRTRGGGARHVVIFGGRGRLVVWGGGLLGEAWPLGVRPPPLRPGGGGRSPDGLFAQQEREPIRGRPAVRGKRTYGGRPGQRVEQQGTWASHTQKHSEAGYGQPVDRGTWTAKTVKRPGQQPAHPQYANYWAPLTRKRHTMPHPAQPQDTNYWAPRTRKQHQQEHPLQRPTECSDLTQHAKGRTGDCPGPRKETTTRRNVTQGGSKGLRCVVSPCAWGRACGRGGDHGGAQSLDALGGSPLRVPHGGGGGCPRSSSYGGGGARRGIPVGLRLAVLRGSGGGGGARPRYLIVCLWRRLLASRHRSF